MRIYIHSKQVLKVISAPKVLLMIGLLMVVSVALSLNPLRAHALSGSNFNPGDIIDDGVFQNYTAMSVSQIQNFLNAKVGTCDTNGTQTFTAPNGQVMTHAQWGAQNGNPAPFTCINEYVENTTTLQNNFSSPTVTIPGGISAAQIIYNAAQEYQINPEVIITTLQKEQGLVTDNWPWYNEYQYAMGYDCPDTSGCSSSDADFYEQVNGAAWQFRDYLNNPGAFNYWIGNNYIKYSPSTACGGSIVDIQNAATAALYIYTPYQPDQAALNNLTGSGDSCSSYGNRNFWYYFNTWFGASLDSGYDYGFVSSSQSVLHLQPGQAVDDNTVKILNTGTATWYADGSAPVGQHAVRLGMLNYQANPFADPTDPNWLGTNNQVQMSPASVAPGQTATFTFNLVAPGTSMVASPYQMFFVPVVDGVEWMHNINMEFEIYDNPPAYSVATTIPSTISLLPNQTANETITLNNTGTTTWYADGSVPAGQQSIRLATLDYQANPFADPTDPNWLGTNNQVQMSPASVAPGQTATFTFNLKGTMYQATQLLTFVPVLNGVAFMANDNISTTVSTPAPNYSYQYITATNPPTTMAAGSTAQASLTIKNTGNVVWTNESTRGPGTTRIRLVMRDPTYTNSPFYDPTSGSGWLLANQIEYTGPTVMPGQTATFNFTWEAPTQPGTYTSYFSPALDGYYIMSDIGMEFIVTVP